MNAQGPADEVPVLVLPESAEGTEAIRVAEAVHLVRPRTAAHPLLCSPVSYTYSR